MARVFGLALIRPTSSATFSRTREKGSGAAKPLARLRERGWGEGEPGHPKAVSYALSQVVGFR
jgi:hypothetical protein